MRRALLLSCPRRRDPQSDLIAAFILTGDCGFSFQAESGRRGAPIFIRPSHHSGSVGPPNRSDRQVCRTISLAAPGISVLGNAPELLFFARSTEPSQQRKYVATAHRSHAICAVAA